MQITKVEVIPVELALREPVRMAGTALIHHVTAVFLRMETREGQSAWGCTVAHPLLTGDQPGDVIRGCQEGAALVPDLHPMNIEYSLGELSTRMNILPSVMCAFDLAFHDLLSLTAGLPLYRILGGYRNRIQTSVTIPITSSNESVQIACDRAEHGFRLLKIKGGDNPEEDVERVQAVHRALPDHTLRLDVDGGYTVQEALDVARALEEILEMMEQPVPADDPVGLRQVKDVSPVMILADQSVRGPASALELAAHRTVDAMSIKLATCGGLRCGRQIDAIAHAARINTMVGCFVEPGLMINAGLSLALSSPNVHYGDLDGYFELTNDPSRTGFRLEDGWLIAGDTPGLGYTVDIG
jgi:L-Ala-D/L-Glu epimerase